MESARHTDKSLFRKTEAYQGRMWAIPRGRDSKLLLLLIEGQQLGAGLEVEAGWSCQILHQFSLVDISPSGSFLQGVAQVRGEGQGPTVQAKDMGWVCWLMLALHFSSLWAFSASRGLVVLLF